MSLRWIGLVALVHALQSTSLRAADRPGGRDAPALEAAVAELRERSERQQRELEALEREVAVLRPGDVEADRMALLRRQLREILDEPGFRESLAPATLQIGYDDGFYLKSSDERFQMRFNGHVQMRWVHYATRSDNRYLDPGLERDDRTGFDLQRLRLSIGGHAFNRDLTYNLTIRADSADRYDARIHYAFLNYRLVDELQVRAGAFRLASTRAQVRSDSNFQFIDRPMVDAVFGLGIGLGVRVWGRTFEKKLEYYLDVVNALGSPDNRTITRDPAELDGNPAVLLRAVWHALGKDGEKEFAADADLPRHASPALDFGFHYAFNDDRYDLRTTRIPFPRRGLARGGGFGVVTTNGLQIQQFGFDGCFKWRGFSVTSEYILRLVDPRLTRGPRLAPWFLATGDDSTTAQHGAYVQCGWFLPIPGFEDRLEAVARIGGVSALAEAREGAWEYAGGFNYYILGNKVKLQADVTRVTEAPISNANSSLANVNDDALVFRVQVQLNF